MKSLILRRHALFLAAVGLAVCCEDKGTNGNNAGDTVNECVSSETCRQTTVGSQVWMAENLNIATPDSWCYGGRDGRDNYENCDKYGRLYTWEAAIKACPPGWRLPDTADWRWLIEYAGGKDEAGALLKSKSGWEDNGYGTDAYGFTALSGGYRGPGAAFANIGASGYWWTASIRRYSGEDFPYCQSMYYHSDGVTWGPTKKEYAFSVRCVAD